MYIKLTTEYYTIYFVDSIALLQVDTDIWWSTEKAGRVPRGGFTSLPKG